MRTGWSMLGMMLAMPAAARTPAPSIPASPAPRQIMIVPPCAPPPEFARWSQRRIATAATRSDGAAVPELALDDTVDLWLAPIGSVALAVPPGKPALATDHGGIVRFRAPLGGTYRIALGGRAWIDVAKDGKQIVSIAHAMGPACSGIAKLVDFRLEPGAYTIQLSADALPTVRIAIAKLP